MSVFGYTILLPTPKNGDKWRQIYNTEYYRFYLYLSVSERIMNPDILANVIMDWRGKNKFPVYTKLCKQCPNTFWSKLEKALFCCDNCRGRWHRANKKAADEIPFKEIVELPKIIAAKGTVIQEKKAQEPELRDAFLVTGTNPRGIYTIRDPHLKIYDKERQDFGLNPYPISIDPASDYQMWRDKN